MNLLVTGAAGFIGSNFASTWFRERRGRLGLLDCLTYAGSVDRVAELMDAPDVMFFRTDVCDQEGVRRALQTIQADAIVHFAAESHVTRGESTPDRCWRTNVEGTRTVLEEAARQGVARIVHVSTDEVYGPVLSGAHREVDKHRGTGQATSAYSKSKSAADDLAIDLSSTAPVVVVRPTNCFGPWQHPEKALPRWITRALTGQQLPVWGDGLYVRQWLRVDDLAAAITLLLDLPDPHAVYNVGPRHSPEITNIALVRWIAGYLGLAADRILMTPYDRPDHDRRYAVNPSRIEAAGWRAADPWEGFAATVEWYRAHAPWWRPVLREAEAIYRDDGAMSTVAATAGGSR